MSTLKVTNIESPSGGGVTAKISDVGGGPLSNRNLIINGAMNVAQRSTSVTGLTNGSDPYQTVDRFRFAEQGTPTYVFTMSQSTDAPDGFRKSVKLDCTTAQASLGADDALSVDTFLEAQNLQSLAYGTSGAKKFTLSFYVKSNVTGNYVVFFDQDDTGKSCTHQYTINAANTWERKEITVDANTADTINDDNGRGLLIRWVLAAGANFTSGTASTTWATYVKANSYVGTANNIAGSTSNEWLMTGAQLEIGDFASTFEHRSFGDELARCQRYFSRSYDYGTAKGTATNSGATVSVAYGVAHYAGHTAFFPVSMRATPSITVYGSGGTINVLNADSSEGPSNVGFIGHNSVVANRNNDSTGVAVNVFIRFHYLADAEL